MIIYGSRNRSIEQGVGIFYCSKCREQKAYKRIKLVRYFTLFFIPLFPLGVLGEYIECQACRQTYQPSILAITGSLPTDGADQDSYYQSSSIDASQTSSSTKSGSCLPLGLILGGALALMLGFAIALLLTLFQMDHPDNWLGFFMIIALCPVPLTVAGFVMLLSGFGLRRKAEAAGQIG